MITHRNILYALRLAEVGNYRRTAESLHITHSALVRGIKVLEDSLEVRLFDRGGGVKVTPTAIGEAFLEHAKKVVIAEADLVQDIQALKGLDKGLLRVAMGSFPSKLCGYISTGMFLQKHPFMNVKISILQYSKVAESVLRRDSEVGITELCQLTGNDEMVIEPLGQHKGAFFCRPGHPLLNRGAITISDLMDYPWCCTKMPSRISEHLPDDLGRAGGYDMITGELIPAIEVDVIGDVEGIIKNSDTLCPTALLMFEAELQAGTFSVVPLHKPWMVSNYGFVYLKHRNLSPSVRAFMDIVRKVEHELFAKEEIIAKTINWNS
ncbi:MAG: LysR family transcriptional regulator [Desulfuromonadales bacterium]|jgi:DNA-binding transcriptional LysR family regulator